MLTDALRAIAAQSTIHPPPDAGPSDSYQGFADRTCTCLTLTHRPSASITAPWSPSLGVGCRRGELWVSRRCHTDRGVQSPATAMDLVLPCSGGLDWCCSLFRAQLPALSLPRCKQEVRCKRGTIACTSHDAGMQFTCTPDATSHTPCIHLNSAVIATCRGLWYR